MTHARTAQRFAIGTVPELFARGRLPATIRVVHRVVEAGHVVVVGVDDGQVAEGVEVWPEVAGPRSRTAVHDDPGSARFQRLAQTDDKGLIVLLSSRGRGVDVRV